MRAETLSILVPLYNEEEFIQELLRRVVAAPLPGGLEREIIVVDDCSHDDTELMVRDYMERNPALAIRYIRHDKNQGKGAAIHTGIHHATGEYLLVQDADLEYDPREYNTLLEPILTGYADVVYGSRFMGGKPHRILFFWHTIGNRFLTFCSNLFTNLNLTDMETGYKAFRTSLIQQIPLKEKRFGFEPEVTARVSQVAGVKIYEVGISYYGRTYKEGKKIGWKDAVRTLFCILKYSLFVRKIPSKISDTVASPVA